MSKTHTWLILSAVMAFMISAALAQGPGMFPWWDGPLAQDLGLSEEQTKLIRATVRDWRDRISKCNDAADDAEDNLATQMNATQVDERKAAEAIEKVIAARSELLRAISMMSLKLRQILTPAQWQELQKRRPPRPAGPPMRNPGPVKGGGPPHRENVPPRPPDDWTFSKP